MPFIAGIVASQAIVLRSVIFLGIISLLAVIARRCFWHPLSQYPGPFFGKFSYFPVYLAVFRRDRTFYYHKLLEKYGSPVRVATDQLIFSEGESWDDIYGQSSNPCLKDPSIYDPFTVTGATNVLNATDRSQASRIRRLLSHGFANVTLLKSEGMIARRVQMFVDVALKPQVSGKPVDIAHKIHEHYLDIISHLSFGRSFECVSGSNPTACQDVEEFFNYIPTISFFPLLKYAPIERIRNGREGTRRLEMFSRTSVQDFINQNEEGANHGKDGWILQNLIDAVDPDTNSKLTIDELVENAIIFLVAGEGTTAVSTIYTLWECSRRPLVQARLSAEIRHAFPDTNIQPTYEVASRLPYLRAVIDETLRVHGPLNAAAPRISPGRTIANRYIPSGTIVSTNGYTAGRDPKVFQRPNEYIPERWIEATGQMRKLSRPFLTGPRNCIGRHLAEIGLVLTLSRIFQMYDLTPSDAMDPSVMRPKDRGVLDPSDRKLILNILPAGSLKP